MASIPPLVNGARLSRDEFERRYDATPGLKKAELIEGVVYLPPPFRGDHHIASPFNLIGWLGHYRWGTPGIQGAVRPSIRLDLKNMPQPDACLFIEPAKGGQARVSEDDYLEGAPEFVAEMAESSVSYDLTTKSTVYRRNGLREYLIWWARDRQIDWFVLEGKEYIRLAPDRSGLYRSQVFPGLWLDPESLIRDDTARLRAALQHGLASPEHAVFVERLNARHNS